MTEAVPGSERPESAADHALRLVEFPRVLKLLAGYATSTLGAQRVRELVPAIDRDTASEGLAATEDMVTFLVRTPDWAPPPIPEARGALARLAAETSVLDETALGQVRVLLESSRRARHEVRRRSEDFGRVGRLAERLLAADEVEKRLGRSLDAAGEIADGASPKLSRLRRQARSERSALVERLERFSAALPERFRVPDASVTLRAGRYCIPIRREGRSRVGGIVHGESASAQSLFVEPPMAIEPMNGVRELELDEKREVLRILAELTELLRPLADPMRDSLDALSELDALYARARYALEHGGVRPRLTSERDVYRVRTAYHPLLLSVDEGTVPFDVEMRPDEGVLLVSGPNAGGKTVLLKSIGLLSAMAQSGIVPPVGEGTVIPVFKSFFAIIGDEQSIDASLSTFSAQIANLREILESSDGRSLVLIDEIGSNTDPAEGAALAATVVLRLADQAALSVVSTHLGDLKTLAGEEPRIVNASLQFDSETLRPTYRLIRDRPGRSYALEISERLGLPAALLEAARNRLSEGPRALDAVLSELEGREEELEGLRAEASVERRRLERERAELAERVAAAQRREQGLERREHRAEREGRRRAERYLLDARREVEQIIQRLKVRFETAVETAREASSGEGAPREASSGEGAAREATAEAESAARRAVERSIEAVRHGIESPPTEPEPAGKTAVGDTVRFASLGGVGRVREIRDGRAVVEVGGVRMTVPVRELEAAAPAEGSPTPKGTLRAPLLEASSEIDVRGLRAEEIEAVLVPALDSALQADLPSLRIIHGKGAGVLRERVRELLEDDPRVPRFRLGHHREGGSGVTVVELSESG